MGKEAGCHEGALSGGGRRLRRPKEAGGKGILGRGKLRPENVGKSWKFSRKLQTSCISSTRTHKEINKHYLFKNSQRDIEKFHKLTNRSKEKISFINISSYIACGLL
ncbi:hypothetical protein KFK09_016606 [Dendrobium nobile]|uniref:Uncharacterized protein n=1 Tax=Dendrobium nobile TaxID=94219 RepID=A0A8T3AZZ6_DENNO|nr:hypothetical protein KFK09_016606 [Dendrobium nobile]